MKNKFTWFAVRCIITAFFASSAPAMFSDPTTASFDFPFWAFIIILVFGSVSMTFSYKRDMKKAKLKNWSIPTWFSNPFSGPTHFMHMGGNAFIVTGLFGLLRSTLSGSLVLMNLFPLAFGWSLIIANTIFYAFVCKSSKIES